MFEWHGRLKEMDAMVNDKPASGLIDTSANNAIISVQAVGLDEFNRLVRDGVPFADSSEAEKIELEGLKEPEEMVCT